MTPAKGHVRKREGFAALFLLIFTGLSISGCAPQYHGEILAPNSGEATIVTYPAQIRGAYILKNKDASGTPRYYYCSEPAPDVAMNAVSSMAVTLKTDIAPKGTIDAATAANLQTEAMALAGRSETVLLARDLLYSICVQEVNGFIDASQAALMYRDVTQVILQLSETDKLAARTKLAKISREVAMQIVEEDKRIDAIVEKLTNGGKTTAREFQENLKNLVLKSTLNKADQDSILRAKSGGELRSILSDRVDWAIGPLYDAMNK